MAKASKLVKGQIVAASISAAATLLRDKLKDADNPHEAAASVIDLASIIYTVACQNDWNLKEPVNSEASTD